MTIVTPFFFCFDLLNALTTFWLRHVLFSVCRQVGNGCTSSTKERGDVTQ